MRKLLVLPLLLLTGCAVQHAKAPQIDAQTAVRLNLASQVDQANRDYKTFFTDVGLAERSGQLTAPDVAALNVSGNQLKGIIEKANALEKTYAQTYDAGLPAQIGALVIQATQIYTALYTQRAQLLAKGVK